MKHRKTIISIIILIAVTLVALLATRITVPLEEILPPKIIIGHAVSDENGNLSGGEAGEQNKDEVLTRQWYNKPWIALFRAKDPEQAEKIAQAMEAACENDCIGYDQFERTTLYERAKKAKWDLSAITKPCETDCSALVAVCVNAAGIPVSKDIYTGNMKKSLNDTGAFECITDGAVLSDSKQMRRGDILLGKGHTVIVLGKENEINKKEGE
jgi:hypothetical protein